MSEVDIYVECGHLCRRWTSLSKVDIYVEGGHPIKNQHSQTIIGASKSRRWPRTCTWLTCQRDKNRWQAPTSPVPSSSSLFAMLITWVIMVRHHARQPVSKKKKKKWLSRSFFCSYLIFITFSSYTTFSLPLDVFSACLVIVNIVS